MKKFLVFMLSVLVFTSCFAQRANRRADRNATPVPPPVQEAPVEEGVITEECLTNLSLFNESARNRQFADALGPWEKVFRDCPSANRAIYTQGRLILHWQLSQPMDEAQYKAVFDKLMLLYDKRMKYFGNDERFPTPWIKGIKALDYIAFSKSNEISLTAYQWLEESIDGMGLNSEVEVLRSFMVMSDRMFKANNAHADKYIQDYLKVLPILDHIANDPNNRNAELAAQYRNGIEVLFAASGAANCDTLDKLYADQVNQNLQNLALLNRILSFYRRVRCVESPVFYTAALAAHKIEPSFESANALGGMAFNKGEFQNAINFYEEATRLSTDNLEKSDLQYRIAQIYFSRLNNLQRTKTHAINSLNYRPENGAAHMIIGLAYAGARGLFSDEILNKTVFWAAVDRLVRAKQIDPSLTEDVNRLIANFSRQFPTKEEIFMHPDLTDGKPFFVGGWISETTICR